MAENSGIEWTEDTFNPWMGCTKVSPACTNCYAERDFDHRYGKVRWGPRGTRVQTTSANWRKPIQWDKKAAAAGTRPRVFCASLADVFEDWAGMMVDSNGDKLYLSASGNPVICGTNTDSPPLTMDDCRRHLFELIDATPNLDWLLLTKRPQDIRRMWPADGKRRENVWLGTSVENQEWADKRLPALAGCRDLASVLFLSCEPLVGPVELWDDDGWAQDLIGRWYEPNIDWVITGGESGPKARPADPAWYRSIRDQCWQMEVPFHFKQWGEWLPGSQVAAAGVLIHNVATTFEQDVIQHRVGKKAAGRLLDGQTHDGRPVISAAS